MWPTCCNRSIEDICEKLSLGLPEYRVILGVFRLVERDSQAYNKNEVGRHSWWLG